MLKRKEKKDSSILCRFITAPKFPIQNSLRSIGEDWDAKIGKVSVIGLIKVNGEDQNKNTWRFRDFNNLV